MSSSQYLPTVARSFAAVFVGGCLGTGLRLGLDALIPHADDGFPLSTLLINIVGSLVLGVFVAGLWPRVDEWMRAGLGPGLLGGFTTFSAVTVSLVALGEAGEFVLVALFLVLNLVLGFGAAAVGLAIGGRGLRSRPTLIDADE